MSTLTWKSPHLLWLGITVLLIGGISALMSLPRQEDPRLTNRFPMVITAWPSASAERIEALITRPLEEAIRTVSEVKTIEADSRPGISSISIELADHVTDVAEVNSRLRDRVSGVQLPPGVAADFDDERGAVAYSFVVALTWQGTEAEPLDLLARLGEDLAEQLRHLPGTERVDTIGVPQEEFRVSIDADRVADLGLDYPSVAALLRAADSKQAAGVLTNNNARFPVEIIGAFDAAATIEDVPLRVTDGQVRSLEDVATVTRGWQSPETSIALHNGERAVLFGHVWNAVHSWMIGQLRQWRCLKPFRHEKAVLSN